MSDYSRGLEVLTGRRSLPTRQQTVTVGQTHTVPAIPRKGAFERDASNYSHIAGGFVGFAASIRCDSVILRLDLFTTAKLEQALALGMKVWLYAGVNEWYPSNFAGTRLALKSRCETDHRILGYVANVERAEAPEGHPASDDWHSATPAQVASLGAAFNEDSQHLSVGLCSFPAWPHHLAIARAAPHMWGSPQLYGIRTPGSPRELLARGTQWQATFAAYCPTLAGWGRTAPELRAYLDGMRGLPGVIFWFTAVPHNDSFAAIRDFEPGVVTRSAWQSVLAALGLGVAGGLITYAITQGDGS